MLVLILADEEVKQRNTVNMRKIADPKANLSPFAALEMRNQAVDDQLPVCVKDESYGQWAVEICCSGLAVPLCLPTNTRAG